MKDFYFKFDEYSKFYFFFLTALVFIAVTHRDLSLNNAVKSSTKDRVLQYKLYLFNLN